MARKWTSDQQKAIFSPDGTILVAAAAGSGKTSVLVQRVINKITDEKNPVDIDKFLIVTFTNAAAREMKERISNSLSGLIVQNPSNLNLYRQQMLLKSASIGTIHSFCNNLVKENFYMLGISPNFKIATENEISLIEEKALESTFEHFYDLKKEEFSEILDIFSGEKDVTELENIIKNISKFMDSLAFPEIWAKKIIEIYEKNENSQKTNIWMKIIMDFSKDAVNYSICVLEDAIKIINNFEDLKKAYFSTFENDMDGLKKILESLNSEIWDETAKKISSFSFSRLKPCKTKENESYKTEILQKRNSAKEVFGDLKKYFLYTFEEISKNLEPLKKIIKMLFEITFYFREEVWGFKLFKNILSFSDLERLSLKILVKNPETLEKSKVAEDISQRFSTVMVDEYQDINEVQDVIFKLITRNESNLFMVGDVKQSIYKFRQSRPKIFLSKKSAFSLYSEEKISYPAKIILGKNFRSKKEIIESINLIFKCLMSEKVGEISYDDEEKLFFGADYEEENNKDVSFKMIDTSVTEENSSVLEAKEIAKMILELISQGYKVKEAGGYRNATFSDFCVLLRKSNAYAHIYTRELSNCAVPSWSETNDKFLETAEISSMISLLKVINNIIDDIPLIACMTSPIFGFNIDEISKIRRQKNDTPFYFALKEYSLKSEKIKDFLEKIEYYRNVNGTMSCSELIDFIYEETQYPYILLALPGGNLKKANLLLLRDYAKKLDDDSSKGLSGFLNFIENLKKKNADLPSACISSETDNTVKVMSIHKSKGLEFPVCILAGCNKEFAKDDGNILIHPDLGFGIKLKSKDGMLKNSNLIFDAINLKNNSENVSEELRVFYVALTRAKQKLIMVASVKNLQKVVQKCLLIQSFQTISPYLVQNSNSFLDWILICLCFSSMKEKLFKVLDIKEQCLKNEEIQGNLNWEIQFLKPTNFKENLNDETLEENFLNKELVVEKNLLEKIKSSVYFEYPFKELLNFPIKMAASKLSHSGEWKDYFASSRPNFLSYSNTSPTARGNAIHKFMCLCEFKNAYENLDLEIERLFKKGLFLTEEIKLLNRNYLKNFLKSNLFMRILKSGKVLREHRFSIKMPVNKGNLENFLVVQGAIDCAFVENNKFVIVDYKTDKTSNLKSLHEKYISQLEIYKYALEQTQNLQVSEVGIYSFYLSDYSNKCF